MNAGVALRNASTTAKNLALDAPPPRRDFGAILRADAHQRRLRSQGFKYTQIAITSAMRAPSSNSSTGTVQSD